MTTLFGRQIFKIFLRKQHLIMNDGPLLVILGATGAGKSKLALDIAKQLNGEIISADSMQVYKGLDIVTNKVTAEEQAICKHHLIGMVSPLEEYIVTDFQKQAFEAIRDIQSRKKLPIICGGTAYYIESILWEYLTSSTETASLVRSKENKNILRDELEAKSSEELHQLLDEIDPDRASKLHPNDRRKVLRSIEIFHQSGHKHSDLIKEQTGERRIGGPLLFKNSCLIWVQCDPEVLHTRIDKRVDKMMEAGLLEELEKFHSDYNKGRLQEDLPPDYERGIFQSIGFKEFHRYLTEQIHSEKEKQKVLQESIDRMKLSTWQYAKYQKKLLRKRFVNRTEGLSVYSVDSTNPDEWKTKALTPSLKLLQHALNWGDWVEGVSKASEIFSTDRVIGAQDLKPIPRSEENFDDSPLNRRVCGTCDKLFLSDKQWEDHVISRRHKRAEAGRKKRLNTTMSILRQHEKKLEVREDNSPTADISDSSTVQE